MRKVCEMNYILIIIMLSLQLAIVKGCNSIVWSYKEYLISVLIMFKIELQTITTTQ